MPGDTPLTGVMWVQPFTFSVSLGVPTRGTGPLCIEDFHRVARGSLTCKSEEDLFEPAPARCFCPQILDRPDSANLSMLNDRDPVAESFRDLERVRGHHDGVSATDVLAKQILQNARRLWIEPDHRLVPPEQLPVGNTKIRGINGCKRAVFLGQAF